MALSILLLLTVCVVTRLVDAQCPESCNCTVADVIDCSGLGLTELPAVTKPESFYRLSRLDFSDNRISILDIDRLLHHIRGMSIDVIDFSNNTITDVNGTFDYKDGKDYKVLDLSRNALQTFPSSVIPIYHSWGSFTLDLSYNLLTELTEHMFVGGSKDKTLPGFKFFASHNLISDIHPSTFLGIGLIDAVVDLRFNRIKSLNETFQPPTSVLQLYLSDNPWHCDCNLRWIITPSNLLVDYTKSDPPACQTPSALEGRPIFELNADDFACLPYESGSDVQEFLDTDSFVVTCPVTADPPNPRITWHVLIPSADNGDPTLLCFDSETVKLGDFEGNPGIIFKCTATNNAGSLTLLLNVEY